MNDCMTFPDTVEEFMEQYKVVDTEHIYTNGSEFVPIFRMKQWFEHLPSAQPEPEAVFEWKREFKEYIESLDITRDDWKGIIEYIDELPSVQPDIIRCKDCKHWNPQLKTANGNGLGSCDFHNVALVTSEGFCYWAERGEQDDSEAD